MNNKKEEKKYFYGKVVSPISADVRKVLLKEKIDYYFTGGTVFGHDLYRSYIDYKYSTVNYGLFGRSTRQVREKFVNHEYFPIILEKKENGYVDVISGENYRVPALPGRIEFEVYQDVDLIWLSNYLKGMTKEKVDNYVRLMNQLKKAIDDEYQKRRSEEIKAQNKYNEAENFINEFRKKYNR